MAQSTERQLDQRLLTHHPDGQRCLDVCHANGWHPKSADVLRLVYLWEQVRSGQRSEVELSPQRLEFARWLYRQGRINDGDGAVNNFQPQATQPT